ncbi:MAG: type I secretion system permease/ATPase [Cyanobacteria bacterium J06597_1]
MTSTSSPSSTDTWLGQQPPFDRLPPKAVAQLSQKVKWVRYRMGQPMVPRDRLPGQIYVLSKGQARTIGHDPDTSMPASMGSLGTGQLVGWLGLVRDRPCEAVISSTESTAAVMPSTAFLELLDRYPELLAWTQTPQLLEVFDLLGIYLKGRADGKVVYERQGVSDLRELALKLAPQASLQMVERATDAEALDEDTLWLVSNGVAAGSEVESVGDAQRLLAEMGTSLRLIGIPVTALLSSSSVAHALSVASSTKATKSAALASSGSSEIAVNSAEIPFAEGALETLPATRKQRRQASSERFPFVRGRGPIDAPMACFQMLSQYFNVPFRRDVVRRVLLNQQERVGSVSLQACGAIAEMMGLNAQLFAAPSVAIGQIQTPSMVEWRERLIVVFAANAKELTIAIPEEGMRTISIDDFVQAAGDEIEVVSLQKTQYTPEQRFSLKWFWPSIVKYRKVLLEVLIASIFVQLFALANPLMVQIIIDKVIVQGSLSTLNVLGGLLIAVALFEGILTAIRTNLFADTTNRIDMTLGTQVINHLLHLPMRYFGRRPVGELASRVNELENIRQFLTGTALTVVLDAIFSVVYIGVMLIYSWLLTIVALSTVPLFALLTLTVAPVLRQQVRLKAERNAATQAYLVEAVSGIETVKAQNIELSTRWQWQQKYARYVSAGFKTVITSSTAGSVSAFLNKLSGLLLLWVGSALVLSGDLTLGQVIAFRIISGYVTQPLLRLIQLWQNFQETALSLERLSDILDHPQEVEGDDLNNIPMPTIKGAVVFENISFRFKDSGPLQLKSVNLTFSPGQFVGIVGQSGSGKSTLMKLLMRLYDPAEGRITVDRYDTRKVDLYSLRRQIGMVLQDSLLFEGTIQENIALTNPDASVEEIVNAAKVAFAHEFIMELPNGYNTRVGERGTGLSGGQRQRIAIARVVLQNPTLLIMDEATSALDYNSERQVCNNLAKTFSDRTVFFITHRLSTIRQADTIVMMDKGVLAEQGTHDELMALRGRYYTLYQQQEAMT